MNDRNMGFGIIKKMPAVEQREALILFFCLCFSG